MGDQWNYNYPPPGTPNYSYPPTANHPQYNQYNQWPQQQYQAPENQHFTYQPLTSYPPPVAYNVPPPPAPQQNLAPYGNYPPQYKQQQGSAAPNDYVKELENYRYIKSRINEVGGDTESQTSSRSFCSMDSNAHEFTCPRNRNRQISDIKLTLTECDTYATEVAEIYALSESLECEDNLAAFKEQFTNPEDSQVIWKQLDHTEKSSVIMKCLDQLENCDEDIRLQGAKCLLYIAQGGWQGLQSEKEVLDSTVDSCILLYKLGTFSAMLDLLDLELALHLRLNKPLALMCNNVKTRTIMNVLCMIVEAVRVSKRTHPDVYSSFCAEITNNSSEDLLIIKLLNMLTKFCTTDHYEIPVKKVLLLLWKLILMTLGGMEELKQLKAEYRRRAVLPSLDEDYDEILANMRPSSPPIFPPDLLEEQNQRRKRGQAKQESVGEGDTLDLEEEGNGARNGEFSMEAFKKKLPWKPKVHKKEVDQFLNVSREKYLGYTLQGDSTTVFGLPKPILDSLRTLRSHVYTPLSDLQVQKEEEVNRSPLTVADEVEQTPAEALYQAMYPNLPQYMISLLKVLLAATSQSCTMTDAVYLYAEVMRRDLPVKSFNISCLGVDINRQREIILTTLSSILLLLLKHFKLNHVYQFEYMSQHLVFANCIPLILKHFNQDMLFVVTRPTMVPICEFPACVLGEYRDPSIRSIPRSDFKHNRRAVLACTNLLRVLNKLCKWKNSRIIMLVVFKSAPILKRAMKVKHAMPQLYILKLLKMQTKYLGRNFRKSNLKTVSLIYQKVRHRLNDDWAYGNCLEAKPWDFQGEEIALRAAVDKFNSRRYGKEGQVELETVDNNPISVLGHEVNFSEGFQKNYYLWLEDEVYNNEVEWDHLFRN